MNNSMHVHDEHDKQHAWDARARRIAKKYGFRAVKSRWRKDSIDNHGGFQLIDAYTNTVTMGDKFDATAEEVIDFILNKGLAAIPIGVRP